MRSNIMLYNIIKMNIMTIKNLLSFLSIIFLILILSSCEHNSTGIENLPEMSFSKDVLPVFQTGCAISGCHDQNTAEGDRVYDSYQNIIKDVEPGNPDGSKVYKIMFDPFQPMPPKSVIPEPDRIKIRLWILQGAKDN